MSQLHYHLFATPLGDMIAVTDALQPHSPLVRLEFEDSFRGDLSTASLAANHPVLTETENQVNEYFAATRTNFDLPLAPIGTPFQQSVWQVLRSISYGTSRSYSEQASQIGHPKAVRAVGAANGQNPIAIIIPCHRVIARNGKLTGYAGGLRRKQWLRDFEHC
ncbi:methylated-DNA--protein-cysteine methyltransferase [Neiella marina]|uniref:Methylated-DNA--protein-cysteine methyltransferase n=1 Tax=Neiella marina TaxID=508461 RepID=A0A8J2U9X8_9GAMM|nr:methylated-DNA--[protein]-cysteine S-methyltransferase [Neiella marina]GGA88260.1 methylated-DNA--protein-cysteine methyltransferase [Neiella marina]